MSRFVGSYEMRPPANGYHYVSISDLPDGGKLKWTQTWELHPTDDPNVFNVSDDCPWKKDSPQAIFKDSGVAGPHGELYVKVGEPEQTAKRPASAETTEAPAPAKRPKTTPALVEMFGEKLMSKEGEVNTADVVAGKTAVMIYFSAHWCPPCRGFTPQLAKAYSASGKANKETIIIFVSADKNQGGFDSYYGGMPWHALPFSNRAAKDAVWNKFKIGGIPSLVVLDGEGTLVSQGRNDYKKYLPEETAKRPAPEDTEFKNPKRPRREDATGKEHGLVRWCGVLGPGILGAQLLFLWLSHSVAYALGLKTSFKAESLEQVLDPMLPVCALLLLVAGRFSVFPGSNPFIAIAHMVAVCFQAVILGILVGFFKPSLVYTSEQQYVNSALPADSLYALGRSTLKDNPLLLIALLVAQIPITGISVCGAHWYTCH